jgi:tetratricopeptide (TPR) repeat protein
MSKGKKSKKARPNIQDPNTLRCLAEEHLSLGRLDEAINLLTRQVEGKSEADPLLRRLLAQAHYRRALRSVNPNRTDLERAVKYDAQQPDYRLALTLTDLVGGRVEDLAILVEPMVEPPPAEILYYLVQALGLLAAGRTREFKELERSLPAEFADDPALVRLSILRHLLVGNYQLAEPLSTRLDSLDRGLYEGIVQCVSGNEAAALESLSEIPSLERNPTSEEARVLATRFFFAGVLSARAGRLTGAMADWREAQRLALERGLAFPWVKRLPAHWQSLATAALAQSDLETALACLEQASVIEPENKSIGAGLRALRLAQANRFSQQGQLDRAVQLWRACVASGLRNEAVLKNLAVACEKLEQMEEAAGYWRQLARLWRQQSRDAPADSLLKSRLARLERHAADLMFKVGLPPHEIIDDLEAALKIDPGHHEVRRVLADILLEIGQTQKALRHLEMIQKQQGVSAQLLTDIGAAYETTGRNNDARRCYERALELDPTCRPAQQMLLKLLGSRAMDAERKGDAQQAMDICQQQLSIDPTHTPALSHLAMLHLSCGQEKQTEQVLQRILQIDPNDPIKHWLAGDIYLEMERKIKAKEQFDEAIEIEPSETCFRNIGLSYLRNGDLKKALKHFDRAIAAGSLETILDVSTALHKGGYDREAQDYLDMALERDPKHPEIYMIKADHLIGQRRLAQAKETLDQAEALAADPKYASVRTEIRSLKQMIRDAEELGRLLASGDMRDLTSLPPELRSLLRKFTGSL